MTIPTNPMRGGSHAAMAHAIGITRRYQWFLPFSLNHYPPPISPRLSEFSARQPWVLMSKQPTMGVLSNLWTPPPV